MTGFNLPPGVETYQIPGNEPYESNTTLYNTHVDTWFERDRAYVGLLTEDDETLIEWWDEAVSEAVEDGFLDPDNWHKSALEYYHYINT